MISSATLRYLSSQKSNDAHVLLRHHRHAGAIYLMGYALEFALKTRICQTLNFANGFPETKTEMQGYISALGDVPGFPFTAPKDVAKIRNHDLGALLTYSGVVSRIVTEYAPEWTILSQWNPEQRYLRQRITAAKATEYVMSAKKLISNEIV